MTYDFKPRANQTKNAKPVRGGRKPAPKKASLPGWLVLVAIILIGSFGYGLYYLNTTRSLVTDEETLQQVVKKATQASVPDSKPISSDKGTTQFEFYSLLPKQAPVLSTERETRPASNEPAKNYHFMLQAGAFKQQADAERRRAELILSGYEAQLEPTKYNNGQTWYRLLIGPFTSQSKLAKARSELLQNNIETLVIKRNN
ncbi:MAG TPA: SPOR domain-containing protein [Pseudomonadales bacterium]|nr:SPOR domain-containing protein [Pseudomonadales bacterium]